MFSQAVAAEGGPSSPVKFSIDSPTVIRSLSGLSELRQEWRSLTSRGISPFQTFSWNLAWYRHFSDCFDEILVFFASGGAVIFPLYRKGNHIRFAGDITCDYQDALAENIEDVRKAFPELLKWAADRNYNLDFRKLSTEGHLFRVICGTTAPQFFKPMLRTVGPCPFFQIGDSPETRLSHLPRKFRAELRRQMRRIAADFPDSELQFSKTPAIKAQDILNLFKFHSDNFRFSGDNPLDDPRLRRLLLEVRDKAEVGLCVSRLGNDEVTMAMDLAFIRGDRFYGYLTAFNCDQARYSPGSCLLTSRLDRLVEEEGVRVLDFLCGSEPYKYRFAQDEYFVRSVQLIPRTATGALLFSRWKTEQLLRRFAKHILVAMKLR